MKIKLRSTMILCLIMNIFSNYFLFSQPSSVDGLENLLYSIKSHFYLKNCESLKDSIEKYYYSDLIDQNIELIQEIWCQGLDYEYQNSYLIRRGGDYCNMIKYQLDALLYSRELKNMNNIEKFNELFSRLKTKAESKIPYVSESMLLTYLFDLGLENLFFEKYSLSNSTERSLLFSNVKHSNSLRKKIEFMNKILSIETAPDQIKKIQLFKGFYENDLQKANSNK